MPARRGARAAVERGPAGSGRAARQLRSGARAAFRRWRSPLRSGWRRSRPPKSCARGLAEVDPEIAALLDARARAPAGSDRADRLGELHVAERPRGGRAACRRTSTPRATRASATTAAARSSTRSRRSRSSGRRASSGPSTRTSSRTPARRRTWPSTSPASSPATRSSRCGLDHGGHLTHGHKVNFSGHLYTVVSLRSRARIGTRSTSTRSSGSRASISRS